MRKRILVLTVASLAVQTMSAGAADIVVKAPPPLPAWSWAGFYAGVDGGYSAGLTSFRQDNTAIGYFGQDSSAIGLDNALFGGEVGYNWQFGHFVIGGEGDAQWTGERGQSCGVTCYLQPNGEFDAGGLTQRLDWFATLRARLGWANDGYLLFVSAGPAWGGVRDTAWWAVDAVPPFTANYDSTRAGLAAGFGLEARIAGRWTGKIEYLYLDLDGASYTTNFAIQCGAIACAGPYTLVTSASHLQDSIIRAGVNYQFGAFAETAPALYDVVPVEMRHWTWTGYYVGLNGGYGIGADPTSQAATRGASGAFTYQDVTVVPTGGFFGGQAGYNLQADHLVYGIEADAQWADQNGMTCGIDCSGQSFPLSTVDQKLEWFATLRGRIGWANDDYLFYATGGGAVGEVRETDALPTLPSLASFNHTPGGWTIGAGAEAHLWGNLSAKIEYLHIDLGGTTNTFVYAGTNTLTTQSEIRDDIFRAGLNYKLGG